MTTRTGRIGKFEIIHSLGAGAMGEVFLARDTIIGREVALKIIHAAATATPESTERFLREAQAAGRLNHPNLVTIHEFGEDKGVLFMAMEYVAGEDLATALKEHGLKPQEALELMAQVCDGLNYAHTRGVLHRDIKPSNIRITRVSGRTAAKILDFGIARLAGSDLTGTGAILGTFGYMAPEYIQSGKPDARADVFAVGVILYEALSGFRPFDGDTAATILHRILNEDPAPLDLGRLAGISPAIQGVLDKAIAKDPLRRFPTAEALATSLRAARNPAWSPEADVEISERRSRALLVPGLRRPPPPPPEAPASRTPLFLLGLGALFLAGALAGATYFWARHHAAAPVPQAPPPAVPALSPPPEPTPAPVEAPKPEAPSGPQNLDQAEATLASDPRAALAFLDPLTQAEPNNERALALRIVALYDTGQYGPCAKAMAAARAAGHPLGPLAEKVAPLRRMLDQERATPKLPRRRPAAPTAPPAPPSA